jgi:long-subunit acyl-CoA synthetase (AMP-forming)
MQAGIAFTGTDCMLSFLPLAHSFDRILEELALCVGGHIGYWRVSVMDRQLPAGFLLHSSAQ